MKHKVLLILTASVLLTSCSSSTMITSSPSGAKLFLNGEAVGTTPYKYSDTKIVGATTNIKFEKEGYETLETSFSRSEKVNVGAIIGGCFVLVPFLWTMGYNPTHNYELPPLTGAKVEHLKNNSKSEELRSLKQLLDDDVITAEEYEKEKKKILDN